MSFLVIEDGRIAREATMLDGVAPLSQLGFRIEHRRRAIRSVPIPEPV